MAWVFLVIAGLTEVFWSTCLKLSEGFSKLGYSALTIVGMLVSFGLLSQAMKTLPLGTAYGIWTGIGALGGGAGTVQGAGHRMAHVFCRSAAGGHRGIEDHIPGIRKRAAHACGAFLIYA